MPDIRLPSAHGTLFEGHGEPAKVNPKALSRSTHPATSKIAAAQIAPSVGDLQKWATDCVTANPRLTAMELAQIYCPTDPRKIGRRLNECSALGMIARGEVRKCAVTGRSATTWVTLGADGAGVIQK